MKKFIATTCTFGLLAVLSACNSLSDKPAETTAQVKDTVEATKEVTDTKNDITVEEPIVIAEEYIYDSSRQVQIVLKKGYYSPGELTNNPNAWSGEFSIRVMELGEVISEKKIDFEDGMELSFPYSFSLHLKDLNGDKALDVAIGQYLGTGKSQCKLYSINKKGAISTLDIDDTNILYIAGTETSPEFKVTKDGKIKYQSFQVSEEDGETFVDKTLIWDKDKFVHVTK